MTQAQHDKIAALAPRGWSMLENRVILSGDRDRVAVPLTDGTKTGFVLPCGRLALPPKGKSGVRLNDNLELVY